MDDRRQSLLEVLQEALQASAAEDSLAEGIPARQSGPREIPFDVLLSSEQNFLQMAIENAADGIVVVTPPTDSIEPRILFANQTFTRITGLSANEVIGQPLQVFQDKTSDQAVHDALKHPLCQRKPFEGEAVAVRRNGTRYTLELLMVPVHDKEGDVALWVAYLRDVSEQKARLETLKHQALHDDLTALPNRALLLDRLDDSILQAGRRGSNLALMITDLDRFKEVNDTYGHHYGDALLQQVADRLREVADPSDTVARMGGDEFAVVLPSTLDVGAAIRYARKIINAMESPFAIEGQRFEVGISIGIAIYPEHGTDSTTLLRRADAAMYKAKRSGIGFSVYSDELDTDDAEALALGAQLREAIEVGQIVMYYQPKIDLRTGLVTRLEALARWQHPEMGLLVPDRFIPIAERTGLIAPLTDFVLDNVLEQCSRWQEDGFPIQVAVNLSGKNLEEHILPHSIFQKLQKFGVDPHRLKLEITESSIMADPQQALALLSLLNSLGVGLSLDDFGTGFSSLVHLRQLPVDEIKIDKSFVMNMLTSAGDAAIVRAMIDLAHNLGYQIVAEGVSTEEICIELISLGCDLGQGYCFTAPLSAAGIGKWLTQNAWGLTSFKRIVLNRKRERREAPVVEGPLGDLSI